MISSNEKCNDSYIQINMYLEVLEEETFGVREGKQGAVGERV